MDKNTVIAIVLSSVILFSFMFINQRQAAKQKALREASASDVTTPITQPQPSEDVMPSIESEDNGASDNASAGDKEDKMQEERYIIESDKVKVFFSNRGGDIVGYKLKDYIDNETGEMVEMADNVTAGNRAFSLAFGGYNKKANDEIFTTYISQSNHAIKFTKDYIVNGKKLTLSKVYTFKDDEYAFKLDISIQGDISGLGDELYTLRTSPQIGPVFDTKNKRYEYRNFITLGEKKRVKTLGENRSDTLSWDTPLLWGGVTGKYFATLVIPENPSLIKSTTNSTSVTVKDYPNSQMFFTRAKGDGESVNDTYYVYCGPRREKLLNRYGRQGDNPWGLYDKRLGEALQTSGILSPLEIALKFIMEMAYKVVHNWGVSIIVTTIFLKLLLFPLTKKSSMATLKMQELQPKINAIQEKYKGDAAKLNEAMAKFYKEAGYNPLSGCLPMLIQFPVLIAMYNLFNNYFEFRGSLFIPGWIVDLSLPDSVYTLGFSLPLLGNCIRILPVIYVISQLLFGKVTSAQQGAQSSGQMKMMMYIMPITFFFLFYNVSSGLLLYWTTSNIFTLVQQVVINKSLKKARDASRGKKGAKV